MLTTTYVLLEYIIRTHLTESQHAHLQSMLCFILQIVLKLWDQSGHTRHFQWSDFVESFYVTSKATITHLQVLILILQLSCSSSKSKTNTMPMTNSRFFHQRKRILENSHLMNVSLPVLVHLLSLTNALIDRSNVSAMLSMREKSHHPRGSSLQDHSHTCYPL